MTSCCSEPNARVQHACEDACCLCWRGLFQSLLHRTVSIQAAPTVLQRRGELAQHCSHHNLTKSRRSYDALLSHKADLQYQLARAQQQQQTLAKQILAQKEHQQAKQQAAAKEASRLQVSGFPTCNTGRRLTIWWLQHAEGLHPPMQADTQTARHALEEATGRQQSAEVR